MRPLFAVLLAFVLAVAPAQAGENLNVQEWLAQPGVRMVAVEFYATWCVPCMEAMPRWKALKEQYGRQGLRVIVVNTQDPDGACRSLPFVPDETVCDLEGHLSDAFKLQGKLPAAFLWNWQGNLLVSKGHIGEVEKAVETYLREAPRVVFGLP
jgi:thiol-disulfide isomerase/thioredoxin